MQEQQECTIEGISAPTSALIPTSIALQDKDVHLWNIDIGAFRRHVDALYRSLLQEEKKCADRYLFPERRAVYVVTRCVLRQLLATYLECDPFSIQFAYGRYGKPRLINDTSLFFNMARSEDKAIIAVSRGREVGVDLEKVSFNLSIFRMADAMFSSTEHTLLQSLKDVRQQAEYFCTLWTRREAFLKVLGMALTPYDIKHLNFEKMDKISTRNCSPKAKSLLLRCGGSSEIALRDFKSFPGYVSAVAFEEDKVFQDIQTYSLVSPG